LISRANIKGRCPEVELLICCSRIHLEPAITDRINSLVQEKIDWEYVVRSAFRNRVMPFLYRNLKKTCPLAVPDDILKQLRSYNKFKTSRSLFLTGKLLHILNLLKDNGILAIPFKGPVLAEYVYGDFALRDFGDLDILVHKTDAIKARDLLEADGYRPEIELTTGQKKAYLRSEYYFTVIRDVGRVVVELHWEMAGKNSFSPLYLEGLEDRLEPATLAGREVLHVSAEDLVLYLCLHGSKDCWGNLEQICSVAELIHSRLDMDWTLIVHLAGRLRCERRLFLGLFMARDLFGVTLPGQILERIKDDAKVPKLADKVYERLFNEPKYVPGKDLNPRFSWFHMEVRDRFEEKIRYASHLMFSPSVEEWRELPLPARLWFLHYLYRPIRLAVGLGLVVMRRCLGPQCNRKEKG